MKTSSGALWGLTKAMVMISLLFWVSISQSQTIYLHPNENINEMWADYDYTQIDEVSSPDGLAITASHDAYHDDSGFEQIYGFGDMTGIGYPSVSQFSISIYGKQVGSPSALEVHTYLAGCQISVNNLSMSNSYYLYTITLSVSGGEPYWTANQLNSLRVGLKVPTLSSSQAYYIDLL